jgi:hypothetical protein
VWVGFALALIGAIGWLQWGRRAPLRELEMGAVTPTDELHERSEPLVAPLVEQAPAPQSPLRSGAEAAQVLESGPRLELLIDFEVSAQPASGASVYYYGPIERSHPSAEQDLARLGLGLQFFERNMRHFVADEHGRVQLPFVRGTLQLVAVHSQSFGMGSFELDSQPGEALRLSLRDAASVEVIVRHATSKEALRDVAVKARRRAGRDAPVGGETDANGRVRLWPLFEDPELPSLWTAKAEGLLREEVARNFTLEDSAQPLELLLPSTGSALLRLVAPDGSLLVLPATLQLAWNDAEDEPGNFEQMTFRDGTISLPCVELDLTVQLRAEILATRQRVLSSFRLTDSKRARIDLLVEARELDPQEH